MKSLSVNNSSKWIDFLRYIACFLIIFVLSNANINNSIFVFGFGAFLALVWCNQNIFILSSFYILSSYLVNFSLVDASFALFASALVILVKLIHQKVRKPIKPFLYIIYALLGQSLSVFYNIYFGANPIVILAGLVLGLLFMACCMKFFSSISLKGVLQRLNYIELISGAIILVCIASGVSRFKIYEVEVIKIVSSFILLCSVYCFGGKNTISISALLGIGTLVATKNPVYVAPLIIWGFSVSLFKVKNKFIPCVALLVSELCIGFLMGLYYSWSYFSILAVGIGLILFLLIPEKFIKSIKSIIEIREKQGARNIVNRSRESLYRRFNNLSDVFLEMDSVYRNMIKGSVKEEDAIVMLVSELKEKVCSECSEKHRCHRTFAKDTEIIFNNLAECAIKRGKVTLLDIPPFLTSRCQKLNYMVNFLNQTCQSYKNYADIMNNLDNGKILIADQLRGVAKIMKNLALEVNANVSFDSEKEEKILDELSYFNIDCREVTIYEENTDNISVTLLVGENDSTSKDLEKAVSKICDSKMQIVNISPSTISGCSAVTLKTACPYNLIFGTACEKKGSSISSGDTYSLIRLESDKYLIALCDGMGSGEKARKTSNLSISLVENFYKAGFDNDIILSSVNKLLALTKDDNFSALDMCILDMRKGVCDFIKLGAPEGFIKREETTDVIESGALPLGILEDIKPMIKKSVLNVGDMIIIMSDGIVDAFEKNEDMSLFINNCQTLNPQTLADHILSRAKELSLGDAQDDMTVLVAKIY